MIQGTRCSPHLSASLAAAAAAALVAPEGASRGEGSGSEMGTLAEICKLIPPMISLGSNPRIQCAGNLRSASASARQMALLLPAYVLPLRLLSSARVIALIRVAVANVTRRRWPSRWPIESAFSRPRDLSRIHVSINRAHVRVNPRAGVIGTAPLSRA